jgi:tetratricopeptide (TPR) repeat protein
LAVCRPAPKGSRWLLGAIADFTSIIELDARNAPAHGLRGLTYCNKRAYQDAIADYTNAIALLDPKLESQLLASHYMVRGLAREKTGDRGLAIANLRRSLKIAPDNPRMRGAREGLKRLGASP